MVAVFLELRVALAVSKCMRPRKIPYNSGVAVNCTEKLDNGVLQISRFWLCGVRLFFQGRLIKRSIICCDEAIFSSAVQSIELPSLNFTAFCSAVQFLAGMGPHALIVLTGCGEFLRVKFGEKG